MNAYNWPADWQKLEKDFGAIFHMSMVDIYDPLTSWYFEAFKINILAFDDAMHRKHGDYEDDGMSLENLVALKYGQDGINLINQLI